MSDSTTACRTPAELVDMHLERELALQRRLISIAEAKRAALIANDDAMFREQTDREQVAANDFAQVRPVRERLVCGLSQHLGVTGAPRLSAVIAKLGINAESLERRRIELLTLAKRVNDLSLANQELLRCGLRVIDGVLAMVVGAQPSAGGYDRRGSTARPGHGGIVNLSG